MSTSGLLFIPDISGFTRFVEKTDIQHSQMIIKKLLESLINCNQMQLQVSEVEGDAILFYRFGNPPTMEEMYRQVEKMFCNFHHLLRSISVRRLCQCGACKEAEHLSLKIITHEGEFANYNINEFKKLIGKDVIRAHQLLKNDINEHEYWLVTDKLYSRDYKKEEMPGWMEWKEGSKAIESDDIHYQYAFLSPLKEQIPEESAFPDAEMLGMKKVLDVSMEVEADYMQLFYLVINLEFRPKWMEGVKAIDIMGHQNNMVGVPHTCIFEKGKQVLITSYIKATDSNITFEETSEKKDMTLRYYFLNARHNKTIVSVSIYIKPNLMKQLGFSFFMKKKMKKEIQRSLKRLSDLYQTKPAGFHHH